MGIFNLFKKKSNVVVEEKPIEDKALVILIDNPKAGMVTYFNSLGIKIRALYKDLNELKMDLMFSEIPTRVIIADSGIGKFKIDKDISSLSDLIEIIKNNKDSLSVITANKNLSKVISKIVKRIEKNDKAEDDSLDIEYIRYDNISSILSVLEKYRERYIHEGATDIIYEEPLKFKGILSDFDMCSDLSFNDFEVIKGLADETLGNSIQAYNVKI